jgi:hypothetical protein
MFLHFSGVLGLAACNHMFVAGSTVDTTGTADSDGQTSESTVPAEPELAGGLEISKISIYQGVEAVLYENGEAPTTLEMPVITGRDALLRVFVDLDADFEDRRVNGILTIVDNNGEEVIESKQRIEVSSKDNDLETTVNFDLSGSQLKQSTEFEVRIEEVDVDAPGGGTNKKATWRSEQHGGLDTEATDTLRVVVVPIRYNADGSGRLPDTSATQLARIEDLVRGTYPAEDVVVDVDQPFDWNQTISPFSTSQWTNILDAISNYRANSNEPPNTYYYGAFAPEPTVNSFCAGGCILGLSYLAFSAGDPFFRASVGIGYTGDITSETLIHEMGHAHGREHAPCGLYGQPADRNYPYDGAVLGSWGYDILTGGLLNPNQYVDFMSYCQPVWVSDYTFYSLYLRMKTVAAQARSMPIARTTLRLAEDGTSTMGPSLALSDTTGAPRVDVALFDEAGAPVGFTTAAFFPYDHVEGGLVALDEELPAGWTAEVVSEP